MSEQTTALAQPQTEQPWALTQQVLAESRLCKEIAEARGIDALTLLAAVKRGIKCDATTADILIFVAQAQKYDLDFIGNPPEIQLLNFGNGPAPYARVDAYKKQIRKARETGELRWAHYAEEWREDPRHPPGEIRRDKDNKEIGPWPKVRCGVVRFQLRNDPQPGERIAWLHEWVMPRNPNWNERTSQMLSHRTHKEFCRDYLGYTIADEDDGERMAAGMKRVEATVTDTPPLELATPVVPIKGLTKLPPPPAPLEAEPQREEAGPRTSNADPAPAVDVARVDAVPTSEPPPFAAAESARIDAEIAAEQKRGATLFDEGWTEVEP